MDKGAVADATESPKPMSEVKFSANPSSVLRALNEIQKALQKTEQAGRKFSEVDFGHPELAKLEEDMRRLQHQLAAFQKIAPGSNLSRGLRQSGQADVEPWRIDWAKAFPNEQMRRQAQARFSQLPQQFAFAATGGHAEQQRSGGSGLPGFIPSTPMGAAGALVGLALGGSIAKAVSEGMANARAHDATADQALRWSAVTRDFADLRAEIGAVGKGLGVIEAEGAKLAMTFAKSSGAVDGAADGARTALGLATGLGMNPESTAQRMGAMRFMGVTDGASKTSQREFVAQFAELVGRSGMGARGEEVLSDISGTLERMTTTYMRPADISALMQFATGVYGSDNAAVRARGVSGMAGGAETLTGYDGGDVERIMLQLRALSDLTTDSFLLRRMTERGPFSRPGELVGSSDTRTLYEMTMEQVDQDTGPYSNPQMKSAYLANMAGVTMDQADEMVRIYKQFGKAGIGSLQARMKAAGVDLESMTDISGISGVDKVMRAENDPQALRALMEQTIKDRDITGAKADELRGLSGDKLADALIRLEAEGGRTSTPTSDLNEAIRKLSDDFAAFGNELNGAKLDLVESMGNLTDPLNKLVGFWEGVGDAVEGKSLWDDGGIGSALTYSPWLFGAIDLGKKAFSGAKSSRSGRSGRNRRTGEPQEAEEAPEDDSGSPLLDWLFKPAEASELPFQSAFDINPPLTPGERMMRALPKPEPSAAQQAATTATESATVKAARSGKGPRSWRNFNPGNLEGKFFGATGNDGRFAIYDSPEAGWAAMDKQILRYFDGLTTGKELKTVRDIIGTWSPVADPTNPPGSTLTYMKQVAKAAGVGIDDELDLRGNPEQRKALLGAMATHEAGRPTPYGSTMGAAPVIKIEPPVAKQAMQGAPQAAETKAPVAQQAMKDVPPAAGAKAAIDALPPESELRSLDIDPAKMGADEDAIIRGDILPKEIAPPGDQVSQRIGTSVRQDPSPPVSLSLNLFQNPVTGAFHVEADREGSGATRIAYGSGRWADTRPRTTA